MTDAAIEIRGLTKVFGATRALDGVDLVVERGEVFGFLGPNGAGKSTTIRVLLDMLRPTSGEVLVLGRSPRRGGAELRSRIGYLPGDLKIASGRRTAGDVLRHMCALRGGKGAGQVPVLAERFGLDLDRTVRNLSKGNRQKVGVVQTFMHDPELIVLDEPTSGLDPLLQHEFRALVREHAAAGATVLMSSHVLAEVEDAAQRIALIRDGRIVGDGDVATLRHHAGQHVQMTFDAPLAPDAFAGLPLLDDLHIEGATMRCLLRGEPDALLKRAAELHVVRWEARDRELDELFLDAYREPTGSPTPEVPTDA